MTTPGPLYTSRLRIVPATAESARAAISDRSRFAALLEARVTDQWPTQALADVEGILAQKLCGRPDLAGWFGWYAIARAGTIVELDTLAASVGCWPPDQEGVVMFGYSVLPAFEGKGIGTEAAVRMAEWIASRAEARLLRADSFEGNLASCRILERCGLTRVGVSPDDSTAPDSDRQGRGTLLRFERRLRT